jgi:hypothetical protein
MSGALEADEAQADLTSRCGCHSNGGKTFGMPTIGPLYALVVN